MEKTSSQPTQVHSFDAAFGQLHRASLSLLKDVGDDILYFEPIHSKSSLMQYSIGALITRSAATVEQMIGGITTKLWDDPFEWTLPERLPTATDVIAYLDEVEASRVAGFKFLKTDEDLYKKIPAPVEIRTLFEVILQTLIVAERLYGNADAVCRVVKEQSRSR